MERVKSTMILNDRKLAEWGSRMINPFYPGQIRNTFEGVPVISFGCSSFGYDIRVEDEYKVFTNIHNTIVDPKDFDEDNFVTVKDQGHCMIPPNSFALAQSFEWFEIPKNVLGVCVGKSTYARCGIIVNVTPLEPGWYGKLTLEISNTTPLPAKIYSNEGIAQIVFFEGKTPDVTYDRRRGKYMNQTEITLPKV